MDVLHYLYKHLKKRHMKRVLSIIALFTIVLTACEGAPGAPGPAGFNGGLITSSAFEIQVDFNNINQYQIIEPYGFQVFEYDMTLVYILWETINR